eukprot:5766615-Amphidinium_carterae.2
MMCAKTVSKEEVIVEAVNGAGAFVPPERRCRCGGQQTRRRLDGLEGWGGTTTDRRRARYAMNVMQWCVGVGRVEGRCHREGEVVRCVRCGGDHRPRRSSVVMEYSHPTKSARASC